MKDDNKICFNKTLTYLVLLVAAVVGAFYVMNYANSQKVGGNTEAAGECTYRYNGKTYRIAKDACFKDTITTWATSYKCVNGRPAKSTDCTPSATTPTCTANKITWISPNGNECRYEKGPGKFTGNRCSLGYGAGSGCTAVGSTYTGPTVTTYDCTMSYAGRRYGVSVGTCFKGAVTTDAGYTDIFPTNRSEKCIRKGYIQKDPTCATATAGPTCTANKITDVDTNIYGQKECTYELGPGLSVGTRCKVGYKVGSVCDPGVGNLLGTPTAATGCSIPYGGERFQLNVNDCLKDASAVNGVNPPLNSIRCTAVGRYNRQPSCAPKCNEYPTCSEGFAFGATDSVSGATCSCFDPSSTTEKPSMQ